MEATRPHEPTGSYSLETWPTVKWMLSAASKKVPQNTNIDEFGEVGMDKDILSRSRPSSLREAAKPPSGARMVSRLRVYMC